MSRRAGRSCGWGEQPQADSGERDLPGDRPGAAVSAAWMTTLRFRHHFSHTWLDRGGAEGDLPELNGWSSPQMLRRYGASARSARAAAPTTASCRTGRDTSYDPVTGAPRRGTASPGHGQRSTYANAPVSNLSRGALPTSCSHAEMRMLRPRTLLYAGLDISNDCDRQVQPFRHNRALPITGSHRYPGLYAAVYRSPGSVRRMQRRAVVGCS
jgi:hypothetical protein